MSHPIDKKRDNEFQQKLSQEQYAITREGGTEPAFSGKYCKEKRQGSYHCICCNAELFSSEHKYNSGSGWPSYFQPLRQACLRELVDETHGMSRTEVRCSTCDAHLGHVFPDGPRPTGMRYCINSLALHLDSTTASK